jgi:hypothetical protein
VEGGPGRAADFGKGDRSGVGSRAGRGGAFALGIAAVIGHVPGDPPLPGWKGVATAGMLIVLYPIIVLGLAAVWFLGPRVQAAPVGSLLCRCSSRSRWHWPGTARSRPPSSGAGVGGHRPTPNLRRLFGGRELHH